MPEGRNSLSQKEVDLLSSQLEERKRNLKVIDECIRADSSLKLLEVRDFLVRRIYSIEKELAVAN